MYKGSIAIVALACVLRLGASAGTLDTTFNPTGTPAGTVTTSIGTGAAGNAVTVQQDGKILVAGFATVTGVSEFAVARYTSAGTLDTTFGTAGVVTTPVGTSAQGNAVVVQQDGKIIVVGFGTISGTTQFALARYTANGSLDTSFNGTGTVATPIGTVSQAEAVVLQSDGKIVVVGLAVISGVDNFAVARYTTAGVLDTTFGTGGVTMTPIGTLAGASGVALQQDGKIVVTGVGLVGGHEEFAVARYTTNGFLDTSFNGTGVVTQQIGSNGEGEATLIQPDGNIVIAGVAIISGVQGFGLARYTTNGTLDTTFGTSGIVTTALGTFSGGIGAALQQNGKIVVAGTVSLAGVPQFVLARYTSQGVLDTTFGTAGIVQTLIGTAENNNTGVALQSDGKILVTGGATVTGVSEFAVARYLGDPINPCVVRFVNKYGPRL